MNWNLPEDENEEDEQGEEHGHVVHGAQHNKQLTAQVGHKANQFQDPQKPEGPQNRQTRSAAVPTAQKALEQLHQTVKKLSLITR